MHWLWIPPISVQQVSAAMILMVRKMMMMLVCLLIKWPCYCCPRFTELLSPFQISKSQHEIGLNNPTPHINLTEQPRSSKYLLWKFPIYSHLNYFLLEWEPTYMMFWCCLVTACTALSGTSRLSKDLSKHSAQCHLQIGFQILTNIQSLHLSIDWFKNQTRSHCK